MKIKEVMQGFPLTLPPDAELRTARALMRESGARHLPVVNDGRLVGLLTDRHISYYAERTGESLWSGGVHPVVAAMQTSPETAGPDDLVPEVAARMVGSDSGCILIVVEDVLIGIVTTTDMLAVLTRFAVDAVRGKPRFARRGQRKQALYD